MKHWSCVCYECGENTGNIVHIDITPVYAVQEHRSNIHHDQKMNNII